MTRGVVIDNIRLMGFEEQVPPVPDRLDEVKMLDRLEKSWDDQSYFRYYMNEDLRLSKMEYQNYNAQARLQFLRNCFVVSVVTLPLAYILRRFAVYRGVIPYTRRIPHFHKGETTAYLDRTKYSHHLWYGSYFALTFGLAYHLTDWHYRADENYDRFAKVKQML